MPAKKTSEVKPETATVTYTFKEVIDNINAKFDKIDFKFNWLTGLLVGTLLSVVATLLTVLLK